jgi:hypothetical protein
MNPISRAFFFPIFAIRPFANLRNALLLSLIFVFLLDATLHPIRAATVSWVGQSGDWSTVGNWSTGSLPGLSDDVVIPTGTSITVTHSTGSDTVNSIVSHQAFTLSGGSLSVANTFQTDSPLILSGGDLINTTVQENGSSLVVSSGTFDGVTVDGTLDVGNIYSGAHLTVLDGLTLNGTALVGNPTNNSEGSFGVISFSGSEVLEGNGTVVFGNAFECNGGCQPWNAIVLNEGETTLVIGPGITVTGQNGQIGYSSVLGGAQNVTVINQGTVVAERGSTFFSAIYISGQSCINVGMFQADSGATLSVQNMMGDVGQVSLGIGSTLSLNGTYTNNLTLNVPSNAVLNLAGTWANPGSINANQGTLNLGGTWSNDGEIQATRGVMTLGPGWVNSVSGGVIQATGGTMNLDGVFTVAAVQLLQLGSGENVNINGTLDNTNTMLVVNGAVATWTLAGGMISGGAVVTTNGGALEIYNGTLDGVTVDGTVEVGSSGIGASLTVLDGLTLNGTMLVGPQGGDAGAPGAVYFSGSQVLSGNGSVVFGPDTQNGIDGLSVADEGTTLVIGPRVTVGGVYGSLSVAGGASLVNQGTISADGGETIRITGGSFSNEGLLEATNGGVIQPTSSPIINSGRIVIDSAIMTFANSFTQTTGTLDFGLNSPTDFGQITFSGSATLGGTLAAHLNAGFQPTIDDSFALLNYGNENPSFTNLSFPSGYAWQTNAANGMLTLAVRGILPYSVTVSPTNSIVAVGSSLTLTAMATGPGPFTFRWSQNGSDITGATSTNLVLTNLSKGATGAYIVTVSNTGASLPSAPVQVLVLAPPVVVTPPPSQTASVGSAVKLSVAVSGDPPMNYQWLFNGADIAGATNSSLSFSDVTRGEGGSYIVVASNPVGGATSAPPAVLTVTTPPICPSAPSGMVAWWPGNGDTSDYAGTNDAVFKGTAAYAFGEVGEAFSFDGFSSYLEVPDSSLWDFDTNDFSLEFWANFSLIIPSLAVGDESIGFLAHDQEFGTRNKWLFGFGGGDLYLYIDGTGIGPKFLVQAAFNPQTNQWYHLGLTKTSGVYQIYVNGSLISVATNNLSIPQATAPLTIGEAQGLFMPGLLDEISIYDRALESSEILAIYQSGSRGKCAGGQSSQSLTIGPAGFNSMGRFQFQIFDGQAGSVIQVQASSDLSHWTNIWQTTMTNGGELFIDPDSIQSLRFYRANSIQ